MGINVYHVGDLVRIDGDFKDDAGALQDPTGLSFKFEDPSGNETTYVYLTDAELVRDGTGEFHVDIDADEVGDWHYKWLATGTGQAAEPGQFKVAPSQF